MAKQAGKKGQRRHGRNSEGSPQHGLDQRALWTALLIAASFRVQAELPTPCTSCGPRGVPWLGSGTATMSSTGRVLSVQQRSANALLNWQSFNVGAGHSVNFRQPSTTSVAINKIFQGTPSRILGALTANGQVYLINQNGIVFGRTAQVNVRSLIASTLDLTPEAVSDGIANAIKSGKPAFSAFVDDQGRLASKDITIESGAQIRAASGGNVLIFAPKVTNSGAIQTPNGQTILAAGEKVYLMASRDPGLRGLLVELDSNSVTDEQLEAVLKGADSSTLASGVVTHNGSISARQGSASLMGLVVNQNGRISATTSIKANGSVRLVARDRVNIEDGRGKDVDEVNTVLPQVAVPTRSGLVHIGSKSQIDILPEVDDPTTDVDVNAQKKSQVLIAGRRVEMDGGSRIVAPSGIVDVKARRDPAATDPAVKDELSRIHIAGGTRIDVSGVDVVLPPERNALTVDLRGDELKDRPLQRDGILRGKTVTVDIRRKGVLTDGTPWVGTPVADLRAALATVQRTVAERSTAGGEINLQSQGDSLVRAGATLDVSGGGVRYSAGAVATTLLISRRQIVDIGAADPNQIYDAILGPYERIHRKWGMQESWGLFGNALISRGPGYIEGRDAGTIAVLGRQLVVDATLKGSIVVGPLQRKPTEDVDEEGSRPFDQLPRMGELIIGDPTGGIDHVLNPNTIPADFLSPDIRLVNAGRDTLGPGFNWRSDVLPGSAQELRLALDGISLGSLKIYSNGEIVLPAGVDMNRPLGGSIELGAAEVALAGSIKMPGGTVAAQAEATVDHANPVLTVASTANVDVRGRWVNDRLERRNEPGTGTPLLIDGGTVDLKTEGGNLKLANGARIDVSGGAWVDHDGAISGGKGGVIGAEVKPTQLNNFAPGALRLGADLIGYGLSEGGRLRLAGNSVCIGATGCATGQPGLLRLTSAIFNAGGFSEYTIASNLGGLTITRGTSLAPIAKNLILDADAIARPTGSDLRGFSTLGTLPEFERQPVSLGFSVKAARSDGGDVTRDNFDELGVLELQRGARIKTEAGGAVAFNSNTRLIVDGKVEAPAGSIDLTLDAGLGPNNYFNKQTIWLGPESSLSSRGASRIFRNELRLRDGELLDGGRITVDAARGYVLTAPGSVIDVRGSADRFDVRVGSDPLRPRFQERLLGSSGGEITLRAAEGLLLDGRLLGAGAPVRGTEGGRLTVALDANRRGETDLINIQFPTTARVLRIAESDASVTAGLGPRSELSNTLNGSAVVDPREVVRGGFDSLTLQARTTLVQTTQVSPRAEIVIEDGVNLGLDRALTLDAPIIRSEGSGAKFSAPYVTVGTTDTLSQVRADNVTRSPAGRLEFNGGNIDLIGATEIAGVQDVVFNSRGDIRLQGVQVIGARELSGSLDTGADVTFRAAQVYPTTLSRYEIKLGPADSDARFTLLPGATNPYPVLSAGGKVTISAPHIDIKGTLKAPIGTVDLNGGRSLLVDRGALISTSALGQIIPFGQTQVGASWVYKLPNPEGTPQTLVFEEERGTDKAVDPFPTKRVNLTSADLKLESGAVIDVSGGGDLQAFEFQPGVGGSRDVLSNTFDSGAFAVVPAFSNKVAPYDPSLYVDSDLRIGDSVYLAGGNGLAAGHYIRLPARYALLPGAFLVREVQGYQDLSPGERFTQPNGNVITAGRYEVANTGIRDDRTRGFEILSARQVEALADYTTTRASRFFARADGPKVRTPIDAGQLSVNALGALQFDASLIGSAAAGGRGAEFDLTAPKIAIVAPGSQSALPADVLAVRADVLTRFNAESLLIGGTRTNTRDGVQIAPTATSVSVETDASVTVPEIILAATESIDLKSGSRIDARDASDADGVPIALNGNGALFWASSSDRDAVQRGVPPGTATTVRFAPGAQVSATGSAGFDAATYAEFGGSLVDAKGAIHFGAAGIGLGGAPTGNVGLDLSLALLNGLEADTLRFRTYGGGGTEGVIDVYGDANLNARSLEFDTAAFVGHGSGAQAVFTGTDNVHLRNSAADSTQALSADQGTLRIETGTLMLAGGQVAVNGFQQVDLAATRELIGAGKSGINTAADLTVATPRITGTSGATVALKTTGAFALTKPADAATPSAGNSLGARIDITAQRVALASLVEAAAGVINVTATGTQPVDGITLASGATLAVSGRTKAFADKTVALNGGAINLRSGADVVANTGSTIDVSAPAGADAGTLNIGAANGTMQLDGDLKAVGGRRQGRAALDVGQLTSGSAEALLAKLSDSGINEQIDLRLRSGDITVGPGRTVKAHDLALRADSGSVELDRATLDASGATGGRVVLAGQEAVRIKAGSTVNASATQADQDGGSIELYTASKFGLDGETPDTHGEILVERGSTLNVSGGAGASGGEVLFRLPKSTLLDASGNVSDRFQVIGNSVVGAKRVVLEPFVAYEDSSIDSSEVGAGADNPRYAAGTDTVARTQAFAANLARQMGGDPSLVVVRPGLEIRSTSDLSLDTTWDLTAWRYNGEPGVLSLRAAGDLLINQSLTDGIVRDTSGTVPIDVPQGGASWSYRLVAGADLDAASPLSVQTFDESIATGSIRVAGGTPGNPARSTPPQLVAVRTTTGDIELAARRDLALGNQQSVIYTAGVPNTDGSVHLGGRGELGNRIYPTGGGDVRVAVQGDIRGAKTNQLITDWLFRTGSDTSSTGWTVSFENFQQGIGALGGGDVSIAAGGLIENLSAVVPSIGRQIGGTDPASNEVDIDGGRSLTIEAGGDVIGGVFYVGLGEGRLQSAGSLRGDLTTETPAAVFALGDAQWDIAAREDAVIGTITDFGIVPQGRWQFPGGRPATERSAFFTFGADSAVSVSALGGSLTLEQGRDQINALFGSSFISPEGFATLPVVYAPTLTGVAASGAINVAGSFNLYPAPRGNLTFLADGDIRFSEGVAINLSDADPGLLPNPANPAGTSEIGSLVERFNPDNPVTNHASRPVHEGDPEPVRLVSAAGSILGSAGNAAVLFSAKPATVSAAQDISDFSLDTQNLRGTDVTQLVAGGDIRYSVSRGSGGEILLNSNFIKTGGPGRLLLVAGGQLDLQSSDGIVTLGRLDNPALPDGGADISTYVGVGKDYTERLDAFIDAYLGAGSNGTYADELHDFVTGVPAELKPADKSDLENFADLPFAQQEPLLRDIFFNELRLGGRAAAAGASSGYARGFAAIERMFPNGQTYAGDLSVFFSRLYTLNGGDIAMFVPGGKINAGIATPPSDFGVVKPATNLGIVVQGAGDILSFSKGDFLVNESRVFATDGGDILIWSSDGDIDAGRGAKTAISAPPPEIQIDEQGNISFRFPPALAGSGIRAFVTTAGRAPGNVDLFAPRGVVNAGDAGIGSAGNITIAATAVIGANNIQAGGATVGVPAVTTVSLAAGLTGVSNAATAAANSGVKADETLADKDQANAQKSTAVGILSVQVLGFGDGSEDEEKKRQL